MSTALYRRYRPDTFADVIGQEHVTVPLMAALQKNRVNHAYLFSGPRGCGKTTSARILARCLNCAQGPTPTPCGTCPSCVELGRGGPGSLDVIEIDAASHGGVDDARDLRERATFAPVRDRYKIFIIDEAHMVTSAGFNALLKIVEEPPEHIKFIFATTEPDKVIGTIRSRTHHYPFRLVPPEPLIAYLEQLCQAEGVPVAPGVLSLVIRAGGGSVRDSLSVLDQLIAGAGPEGLDYELAVSLLGYTHASLLDDVVDAMAAQDAATVFGAVDRVIQTGHDPRRFVEDLLERFRDLIIVKAMPDTAGQIIRGLPEDQLNRMRAQASLLGQSELSRSADITNQALTEMTGATSPRLHLELLCARLLLPASDPSERGINARVDRLERRVAYAGDVPAGTVLPAYDGGGSPSAESAGFESPREQGAAQVREALRAARRGQEPEEAAAASAADVTTADLPAAEPAPQAAPVAAASPNSEQHAAPGAGAPADEAPVWGDPAGWDEPVEPAAEETAAPAPAPAAEAPAAAQVAAPAPSAPAVSPDWGGTWGAMPEPEKPQAPVAAPAPAAASVPGPAAAPNPAPMHGNAPAQGQPAGEVAGQVAAPAQQAQRTQAPHTAASVEAPSPESARQQPAHQQPAHQQPARQQPAPQAAHQPAPAAGPAVQAGPTAQPGQPVAAPAQATGGSVEMFRRAWPEIMNELQSVKKFLWMTVQPNASVTGYDGRSLTVSFAHQGAMTAFTRSQDNIDLLAQCIHKVLGVQCQIVVTAGGSAPAGGSGPKAERRPAPADTASVAPRPAEPAAPAAQAPVGPAPVGPAPVEPASMTSVPAGASPSRAGSSGPDSPEPRSPMPSSPVAAPSGAGPSAPRPGAPNTAARHEAAMPPAPAEDSAIPAGERAAAPALVGERPVAPAPAPAAPVPAEESTPAASAPAAFGAAASAPAAERPPAPMPAGVHPAAPAPAAPAPAAPAPAGGFAPAAPAPAETRPAAPAPAGERPAAPAPAPSGGFASGGFASGGSVPAAPAPAAFGAAAPAPGRAAVAPPAPTAPAPTRGRSSSPATPPADDDDPGYGPEPDFGPEPFDDGAYDWNADSVPVPDWELPTAGRTASPAAPAQPNSPLPQDTPARPTGQTVSGPGMPAAAAPAPQPPAPAAPSPQPVAPQPTAPRPTAAQGAAPQATGRGEAARPASSPVGAPGAAAAPAPDARVAAPTWGKASAPAPSEAPPQPQAARPGQRMSRYQQLMNQAGAQPGGPQGSDARPAGSGQPGGVPAPGWGSAAAAGSPAAPNAVDSKYVEDIPSDDDIAIEESGLVGRPAIERLLNGRLIEERDHEGNVVGKPAY